MHGGVLQHGSLPLLGDLARVVDYLAFPAAKREAQRQRLHHRALTLEEAAGARLPFDRVARALAQGFAVALNLRLVPGELMLQERALAAELRDRRYADPDWTARL
jgi:lipoate-protein ligase A